MFFTKIGKILAHLLFWRGLLRVGMGFLFAFGPLTYGEQPGCRTALSGISNHRGGNQ